MGEFSALPHGSVTPQIINEGSILLIDGGCSVEGYRSDISRTFVLGQATDRMKEVFDVGAPGPGRGSGGGRAREWRLRSVDTAARSLIEEAGFGPGYTYFTHRVGHGIGMDGHEWPYLVKGNTLPLQPGHDLQRRAGDLHSGRVRSPDRG